MVLRIAEFLVGLVIAAMTLRDVFDTVVVPGGSRASLRVTRRVGHVYLFLWKHLRRRPGISGSFAPATHPIGAAIDGSATTMAAPG